VLVLMCTVLAGMLMVMALGIGVMLVSMGMLVLMFMFVSLSRSMRVFMTMDVLMGMRTFHGVVLLSNGCLAIVPPFLESWNMSRCTPRLDESRGATASHFSRE
jgi:hypothetical protein